MTTEWKIRVKVYPQVKREEFIFDIEEFKKKNAQKEVEL